MSGEAEFRSASTTDGGVRMGGKSATVAASEIRIGKLLRRLGWATTSIALVAVFLVATSFYWLQVRPQADATAKARENEAAERVVSRIQDIVGQVGRLLGTLQAWSVGGLASIDDPDAFNRLLIPVVELRTLVSSLHLATDEGREILLLETPEGFRNRITDIPKNGTRQQWLSWKDTRTRIGEEWKEQDYDPRQRPWFTGALATPEYVVHWTEPYVFQTTKEPGITASMRWTDKASGRQFVVAIDVLLTDFSRSTRELHYGEHGQVAVVTSDGKVLGVPRNARIDTDEEMSKAILQLPENVGLPALAAALAQARGAGDEGKMRVPKAMTGYGEDWLATLRNIPFGNRSFRLAMLAPLSDFSPWSQQLIAVLLVLLVGVAALSVFFSRRLAVDVSRPLGKVFRELAASNRGLEAQGRRSATVAELATRLQSAETLDALSQALLSGLAQRVAIGQGSVYRADADARCLRLCGGYARTASSPPAEIAYGEGLLGQCAIDQKTIRLDKPTAGYLRLESALGAGEPTAILVLPVINNGVLLGVVELATLAGFDDETMALIDSLLPMFALCMEIIARSDRTHELLRASLTQSAELAAQQERIQSMLGEQDVIFSKAPMGIMYAAEGRLLRVNAATARLFGRAADELSGTETVHLFVSPESYREFAAQVGPKLAAGEDAHIEWPMRRADGTVFQARLSAQGVEMAGVERAAIWILEDISERKRLEEATRASEARLRQVLEDCPAAVTMVRENGEQLFVNRRLADLFGVSQEELKAYRTSEFWVDADERQRYLERLRQEGRIDDYETTLRRADGSEARVLINTRWIEQGDERLLLSWLVEISGDRATEAKR